MSLVDRPAALVESIAEFTGMCLGGASELREIVVELFPREERAIVYVDLKLSDLEHQLRAMSKFFEVQENYEDELQLEIRFGIPTSVDAGQQQQIKSLVLS